MPILDLQPIWKGHDAFVIGGGPSLRSFDWNFLREERTIGCNTAYVHGPEICDYCVFGDKAFWRYHEDGLKEYGGPVVTTVGMTKNNKQVYLVPRQGKGLATDALGWNGNTGSLAINLALIFGARRIYLLGFDMKRTPSRSNWHDIIINPRTVRVEVYQKFIEKFQDVVEAWHQLFGDREIINVTDDSDLEGFPKVGVNAFWEGRLQWQSEQRTTMLKAS